MFGSIAVTVPIPVAAFVAPPNAVAVVALVPIADAPSAILIGVVICTSPTLSDNFPTAPIVGVDVAAFTLRTPVTAAFALTAPTALVPVVAGVLTMLFGNPAACASAGNLITSLGNDKMGFLIVSGRRCPTRSSGINSSVSGYPSC